MRSLELNFCSRFVFAGGGGGGGGGGTDEVKVNLSSSIKLNADDQGQSQQCQKHKTYSLCQIPIRAVDAMTPAVLWFESIPSLELSRHPH